MRNRPDFSNPQEALDRMTSEAASGRGDAGGPAAFDQATPAEGMEASACRICGRGPARLATYMHVMSFAVFSRWKEYPDVLCRGCSTRTALREQAVSALLGWWGIPWGLLTLKALWVNGRTLARWSLLPALPAVALSLLGLAVPAGLFLVVARDSDQRIEARATGNWVDEEVARLVDAGHESFDRGDHRAALLLYLQALPRAPDSSVINSSVAHAHFALGEHERLLPYAEKAARANPRDVANAAVYTIALTSLGREPDPAILELLSRTEPRTADDAYWMGSAFYALGAHEQELRVSEAGLAMEPNHLGFALGKAEALIELGRAAEAREFKSTLPPALVAEPDFAFLDHLLALELRPEESMREVTTAWFDEGWSAGTVAKLVAAAERSGHFEQIREHVRSALFAGSAPPAAWASAGEWFGDDWTAVLDDYLSLRTEFAPGYVRLQQMDPRVESSAMVRLAQRLSRLDHPQASWAEPYYFSALSFAGAPAELERRAAEHAAAEPDHVYCRYTVLGLLSVEDPARRWKELDALAAKVGDDVDLARALAVDKYEMQMAWGQAEQALAGFEATLPDGGLPHHSQAEIELLAAEAAFHARDTGKMVRYLRQAEAQLGDAAAAAYLLRWSAQLASGQALTYRQDVDRWLKEAGGPPTDSASVTAQAILVAEGLRSLSQARHAVAYRSPDTFALVQAIHDAAESGRADVPRLAAIAASERAGDYAPRLARTLIDKLGAAAAASSPAAG